MSSTVGESVMVRGFVTKEKYLVGRTMSEIERSLGFHLGRLGAGAVVIKLDALPLIGQFSTAGYSQVAEHRYQQPGGLNMSRVEQNARDSWSLDGLERLVKVRPALAHDPDMDPDNQYPPGQGVPQWKLNTPIPGTVVAILSSYPNEVYRPSL